MREYKALAPAKINLALHVIGQRPDGFHALDSLVVFAGMGDRLSLSFNRSLEQISTEADNEGDTLHVIGPFANSLGNRDEDNMAMQALRHFQVSFPQALTQKVHLKLEKNLPVSAGIGGGSADAAAMLTLLGEMAPEIPATSIRALAEKLGADASICLQRSPMRMQGIGHDLHQIKRLPEFHLLLANPNIALSTPEVFRALRSKDNPPLAHFDGGWQTLPQLISYLQTTRNDLQGPAVRLVPEIKELLSDIDKLPDCLFSRMSGSGATVFGIFATAGQAAHAATQLAQKRTNYWIASAAVFRPDGA